MSNINDYLLWRGDLLFAEAGFNEVDNLIFSELVYVDFRDIAPSVQSKETISLKEASRLFFERHTDEEIQAKVSSTKVSAFLMREMAKTRRFSEARLGSYVDEVDPKEQSQFCAMTIKLDDGSVFVAYSGTDSTMIGWRENFNMSFLTETPGQLKAVEYLNQTISPRQKKIRIGGHSKGGNLAVYACIYCKESIQNRILAVYSNDGPGFMGAMMDKDEYRSMLSKIHTFIPESSIVGLLLEREEDYELQLAMRQEWEQINVLVNGVLFGSRTTCLREDLVIREENLKKMIQQSIKHNAFFLIKYRFEVQLEFESVTVWTDRKWLVYVLDQLLLNAIKYRSKTPMLTFSVVTEPGVVHLTVHDNGCGIKEEEIPRIFNKGFTGSNGRKETYKSTGMGLYFSKRILDRLGHPIVVQSEVSKSTDMTISFYQLSDYANLTKVSH